MQLHITGQIHGGKNNMGVTRMGFHYPKPAFVKWRAETIAQLQKQIPPGFVAICDYNRKYVFIYTPEDKRRRDLPAVLDALFHCFEKVGLVADDCYICNVEFIRNEPNKKQAGMDIEIGG